MKINKIYADKPFKAITFNDGLNVILGEPKDRGDREKDTHNLGKTLLLELIDFLMLKQLTETHFLKRHSRHFSGYHFSLELKLNDENVLTIRRGVDKPSRISFKFSALDSSSYDRDCDLCAEDITYDKAKTLLNKYLGFDVAMDWDYRKSVSYFLRGQQDFSDVFQLAKYNKGRHVDWKPFLFNVLGFDSDAVRQKYDLEDEKKKLEESIANDKERFSVKSDEIDKLQGLITLEKESNKAIEKAIDDFEFYSKNKEINTELVDDIDRKINTLNTIRYNTTEEIARIEPSLKSDVSVVDMDELQELYGQVGIFFPQNLVKEYQELEKFNKKISLERNAFMKERLETLRKELVEDEKTLKELETRKSELLSILKDKDSYQKFKEFQKKLSKSEASISRLEERLGNMLELRHRENELKKLLTQIDEQRLKIREVIDKSNDTYKLIRSTFSRIIQPVLNVPALISIQQNKEGNIEFHADIQNPQNKEKTAEGYGTTYRKLLCMAFDLAVLIAYSERSFYKFVYHDGALESLDDRKKINFINKVREICSEYGLQYIMTVIDSDIPHDEADNPVLFSEKEVVLKLHDRDDSGRLFEMSF